MILGNTANEYGDFFIAGLTDPYMGVKKIIDWTIIAGVQGPRTPGSLTVTAGSTTIHGSITDFTMLSVGEEIVLGNHIFEISSITGPLELELTVAPDFSTDGLPLYLAPNVSNFFEYKYRWSDDNQQYSEFRELNKTMLFGDLLNLNFDETKPLWLDIKLEVAGLSAGNSITLISFEAVYIDESGQVQSCPQLCVECTDPFAYNGCANIEVSCDDNTFQPYSLNKSIGIYKELVNITTSIFGHEVQYFRTEPNKRTEDVILMEYSLHNVVDKKTLKILVPDNEFPDEITYDIFGMEFSEFEVHITANEFETIFGQNTKPRNLDYMYIPLINKMYEISSIGLADEFMHSHSYYRVKLVKYQDRSSVIKNNFEDVTDNLITGVEEIFGERQSEEMEKDTNPQQFQTVSTSYRDGIRLFVGRLLKIHDYSLKNRWTVISKNHYDLDKIEKDAVAIEYSIPSKLKSTDNLAVTLWFNPQFNSTDTNEYILFGDMTALTGLKIMLSNTSLRVLANGIEYDFIHGLNLQKEWYGLVININNKYLQLGTSIYRLDQSNNMGNSSPNRPQDQSNNLIEEYTNVKDIGQPLAWISNSNYALRGNKTYMTNIRVFERVIELEQHHNVLNQYVVRDNQLSTLIDNAIPSLGYQRFRNAR